MSQTKERIITPSQVTHVILASHHFGSQENSQQGIKAHQQSVHNVASRVTPIFPDFELLPNQIPAQIPQYIHSETIHETKIGSSKNTTLRVKSDLEIIDQNHQSTLVVEIKPTPQIRHGIQAIATCMTIAKETNQPVQGGIYHYQKDSVATIPEGGKSTWNIIEQIYLASHSILEIQNTLDKDKDMSKITPKNPNKTILTWQPNLPGLESYQPLSKAKIIQLSDQAITIRREQLEPLILEISPLISSWIKGSTQLS